MDNSLRFVYITTGSEEEARNIGKALVNQKLAACVNILNGMQSIYRWEGKIEEANEVILVAKTIQANMDELTKLVCELHSYECPCVISLPVSSKEGNPEYIDWLIQESKA